MALKHAFKSLKPDPADTTVIGASKWNADHYYVDTAGTPIATAGSILIASTAGIVAHGGWLIPGSWDLHPWTDNTVDIGTASLRPRAILAGTAFRAPGGTEGTPSISFASETTTGWYLAATGIVDVVSGGTAVVRMPRAGASPPRVILRSDTGIGWGSGAIGTTVDTALARSAAGVVGVTSAIAAGTNPAQSGAVRIPNATTLTARNNANTVDINFAQVDASNVIRLGNSGEYATLGGYVPWVNSASLGAPPSPANGDWWVEASGTSPARVAALKVRDGGVTRTIASVTY